MTITFTVLAQDKRTGKHASGLPGTRWIILLYYNIIILSAGIDS